MRPLALRVLVLVSLGCAGAGPYGHARSYLPTSAEEPWIERAQDSIYDEVRRMPDLYRDRVVSWFGVVTGLEPGPNGSARVALQVRTHQERHLCEDESNTTCRVTVSQRDGGAFTAVLTLRPEDAAGENQVQPNSLLRVFGTVAVGEYDSQGGPVLRVQYYRHWPRGEYVTTASANTWRR
jgi:hypothetical protein